MQRWAFCKTVSVAGGTLSPQFHSAIAARIPAALSLRTSQPFSRRDSRMVWRFIVSTYGMNRRATNKNKMDNL